MLASHQHFRAGLLALTLIPACLTSTQASPLTPKAGPADIITETKAEAAGLKGPKDPLDMLRDKLAQRLGAAPRPGKSNVVQVITPATANPEPGAITLKPGRHHSVSAAKIKKVPMPTTAQAPPAVTPPTRWSHIGETGPQTWGHMNPEFAACATGTRQSPIDIRDGIKVDLDEVQFNYQPSAFGVIDNGHTVQVNIGPGNSIEVLGRTYELVQLDFHRPSEERIQGKQFEMSIHLLHKDPQGRLAMVAILLESGTGQPVVQTIWNNLPLEKGEEVRAKTMVDLNALLPTDRRYYTYMGSLTTPPCSEGVLWMVMKTPQPVSSEQIDIFSRLYPMNARPVQPTSGRLIKESN